MRSRSFVTVSIFAFSIAVLAGCAPSEETGKPSPSATTTESPAAGATPGAPAGSTAAVPTATAPASAKPTPQIIPLDIACDELISPAAMYEFNSNLSLLSEFSPEPGSAAAEAVAAGGIACRWTNGTSGAQLDLSAAELTADDSTDRKNSLVQSSNSVPTYGVEGYFLLNSGVGEAQAFPDPHWLTVRSTEFFEPGDVSTLMATAIAALG